VVIGSFSVVLSLGPSLETQTPMTPGTRPRMSGTYGHRTCTSEMVERQI